MSTWVPKTDGEIGYAQHINDLQDLKVDLDVFTPVAAQVTAQGLLITQLDVEKTDLSLFDQLAALLTTGSPSFDKLYVKRNVIVTGA